VTAAIAGSFRAQKPIRDERGVILAWFGTNTDVTELLDKEEQIRILLMEVNHRSKNMLAVVQALARRSGNVDPVFLQRFEQRLASMSANQDLLVRRNWATIPMGELATPSSPFSMARAAATFPRTARTSTLPRARPKLSAWRCTNWPPMRSSTARFPRPAEASTWRGAKRTGASWWSGGNGAAPPLPHRARAVSAPR
jgi:hypothetical protein